MKIETKEKTINQLLIAGAIASAETAINDCIKSGVPLAVWKDGKVVDITPQELIKRNISLL